jgi:hypothetical protein
MAQDIPDWLLGRGITTISVTPQTYSAGTLTDGTVTSYYTVVDEINWSREVQTEEIAPITSQQINNVRLAAGDSFTLQEILRSLAGGAGTSFNTLAQVAHTSEYHKVIFTRPGASGFQTWTGFFLLAGYDEAIRRGKSTGVARFVPIQVGETAASDTYLSPSNMVAS